MPCSIASGEVKTGYAFINHIKPGSVLVHDKESTHKKLIKELGLINEEYAAKDLKGLDDFENPLDPVNHLHYLIKRDHPKYCVNLQCGVK